MFRGILVHAKMQSSLLQPACSHIMGCLHLFSRFSLFAKCTRFVTCEYCQNLLVLFKRSKPYSLQTTDYEMIRVEGVRVWRFAGGLLAVMRTPGLLLIGVTDYSTAIQWPNTFSFSSGVHWASALCESCMMGSSNSSFATKSCACASVAFLVRIIFWFVDNIWRGVDIFT
jgi:hypothetical protein